MAFFLRTLTFPPLNQILAVPQIVVIDQTGPTISFGTRPGAACLVGEFIGGPFVPTEVTSTQDVTSQYTADGTIYRYLSQDGAATPVQNGGQVGFNGHGMLQLLKKTFQRLILVRVDHEAVTTDGGSTKAVLQVTVTVAAVDQDGASNTNKDIVIPAGARFGDNAVFGTATKVFAVSGNITIPKGTALTTNACVVTVPCFPVKVVEPVVSTTAASVNAVIDPVLQNVAATTTITAVTNASALWPAGTGTTLATRVESVYPAAIGKTLPSNTPVNDVVILWAARRSVAIRQALATNAKDSSEIGRGRIVCVAAEPAASASSASASAAITAAIALAGSDGYVQPADRVVICFPASKVFVEDFSLKVTINSDGWMASTLSNFAEEFNPGIANNPFIQSIVELEDAFIANPLSKTAHANLIAGGVAALYHGAIGWEFMQGVTAANPALFATRTPIKRRRMADLIQDTLNQLAAPYQKGPATLDNVDTFVGTIHSFLDSLLSPDLPAAQRIVGYLIDETSGNTQPLNALGVYVFKVYVRTLPSLDFPVFVTQIGETVVIPTSVAAAA